MYKKANVSNIRQRNTTTNNLNCKVEKTFTVDIVFLEKNIVMII